MKEKLYTIPLMDAFKAGDECPFCFVERQLEQHSYDFVLASQHQIGTLPDFCLLDYGKLEVLPLLDEYQVSNKRNLHSSLL